MSKENIPKEIDNPKKQNPDMRSKIPEIVNLNLPVSSRRPPPPPKKK